MTSRSVTVTARIVVMTLGGLLLLSGSILSGCTGTNEPQEIDILEVKIDGVPWSATSFVVGRSSGEIFIDGSFLSDLRVSLQIDSEAEGTYRLGIGKSSALLVDEEKVFRAEGFSAGELTITSITDDRIEGTFGFVAKDPNGIGAKRDVTNGRFSLPFFVE